MTEFIPTNDMTLEEKLNSITRLSIYLSAILTAYTNNTKYLYFFIMTLLLTHLIYVNMSDKLLETFSDEMYVIYKGLLSLVSPYFSRTTLLGNSELTCLK